MARREYPHKSRVFVRLCCKVIFRLKLNLFFVTLQNDDLNLNLEKERANALNYEKKQKKFDQV